MLKGIVRQADCPNQIGALGQIFPDRRIFLIHGSFAGDEGYNTTWTYLVQGLSEKVIVDQPMIFIVSFIHYLEIAERDVSNRYIKKAVRHLDLFKAIDGNMSVLIKLLGNPAADGIQFHTIEFAIRHIFRKHTKKVADAAGRFQNISLLESHLSQRLINSTDQYRRSVESSQGTGSGRCKLIFIQ